MASLALLVTSILFLPISSEGARLLKPRQAPNSIGTPCAPGGTPELYKPYGPDVCPPVFASHFCTDSEFPDTNTDGTCQFEYCGDTEEFRYTQEVPVPNAYCHGPESCGVTSAQATTYTYSASAQVSPDIIKALKIAITGGFSAGATQTNTRSTSISVPNGKCGYFSFIPIIRHSCGTVAHGSLQQRLGFKYYCRREGNPQPNQCFDQTYRDASDKTVLGDTVFVWTDCGTHARLPMVQQDPAYQKPGVALPQAQFDQLAGTFPATRGPAILASASSIAPPQGTALGSVLAPAGLAPGSNPDPGAAG